MSARVRLESYACSRTTHALAPPLSGLAALLLFGAGALALSGVNPLEAVWRLASSLGGSWRGAAAVGAKAVPLAFTGLAVAVAGAMRLWNIGAEGQLALGAVCSAGFGLYVAPWLPAPYAPAAGVLAAIIGGALWAAIPATLKVAARANEVLTTLFLNYVAAHLLTHLYYGPWRDPAGYGFPSTALLPASFWLPRIPGTYVSLGLPLACLCALGAWLLLRRTRWGFEIRVAGASEQAARYGKIPAGRNALIVLTLSGAIAGLAGGVEILAVQHRLQDGLLVGHGYTGIIVAFMGRLHPLGVLPAALLLAAFLVGVENLHLAYALPSGFGLALEGILLLGFLAGEALCRYRLRFGSSPHARDRGRS